MTVALTVLGGLALLVLGQIVIRSFVDPIYEIRKLRGEIADALIYHANVYMSPRKWNKKMKRQHMLSGHWRANREQDTMPFLSVNSVRSRARFRLQAISWQ
jgi:hypothetical protein